MAFGQEIKSHFVNLFGEIKASEIGHAEPPGEIFSLWRIDEILRRNFFYFFTGWKVILKKCIQSYFM